MKIVKLEASNVKRLVAVEITPDGSLVVVGGKNGAGKSSTLDSIAMALGGKDLVPEKPLRSGAEKGHVEVDLGDLVVRRTFTAAGGGTLTVSNRDGARYPSPQKILDDLTGRLTFDPLAFSRMDPRKQLETLRALVGVDFSALDRERAALYEERTAVGRTAKALEGQLAGRALHEDAPESEVSVAALMAELDAAQARIREIDDLVAASVEWERDIQIHERAVSDAEARLAEAKANLDRERELLAAQREGAKKAKEAADAASATKPDVAPIRAKIASADEQNRKHRENLEREEIAAELDGTKREVATLSAKIEALDRTKEATLAGAAFPVPGLSFDESGVLLNGLPFSQASSAEQLRVSVAMGLAMNPKLRVLLIRDGSLLDAESLRLVAEMAEEAEAQVWMERVGDGAECSVVIEDGHVREVRP